MFRAALLLPVALFAVRGAVAQEPPGEELEPAPDLTETIPSSSDDSVETIPPSDSSAVATTVTPTESASPEAQVQLSGYARQSFELVYGELKAHDTLPAAAMSAPNTRPTLWRDAFTSRTQLVLSASYVKRRHFEATVSGLLGYNLHVAKQAPVFSTGVVDLTQGELDQQLRDAYLGFFWPSVELRIGQQRVAWGKSDFQSPNDVINARDLRDPFLGENELRYLPTPVIRSSISGGPVTFEAVVSPFFIPDRFDVYGSNWAAIQPKVRDDYEQFLGSASLLPDPSEEREFARLFQHTERPPDNGKGVAAGARLSASLPGTDFDVYYHYGYDTTPLVTISPEFLDYLASTTFVTTDAQGQPSAIIRAENFAPLLKLRDTMAMSGRKPFSSRYVRRQHVGADLVTTFGPIAMKLDAAYETQRVFYYARDLNSFASPTVLGTFGLEYQTGNIDDVVLVELLGARLLDKPAEPLFGYQQTSIGVAGTLRWALGESWGLDFRGVVGIQPKTYVLQPAIRFKPNDSFTLRLGALLVSGEQGSFGWYYGDNDTAFLQLRYAF